MFQFLKRRKKLNKIKSYYLGLFSEYLVILYLILQLYFPIKLRYRNRFGEIDLICYRFSKFYFFEIKFRKEIIDFSQVVSFFQLDRIKKSAMLFMRKYKKSKMQIDFIFISVKFPFIHRFKNVTSSEE